MTALRIALAFGRPDVHQLLSEIDHEQYEEWAAFFALEPHGWTATQIATTRLSYMIAQVNAKKRLKERDFEIKIAHPNSAATERARWEAMAVRTEIAEAMNG